MQVLAGPPYAKRAVPAPDVSVKDWPARLSAWLGVELANVQRGTARATSRTVTTDTLATTADGVIVVDATGAPVTVTLPDPASAVNSAITIKRINAGANAVTIGGTVDGAVNPTLASRYDAVTVWAHVAAPGSPGVWYVVSRS